MKEKICEAVNDYWRTTMTPWTELLDKNFISIIKIQRLSG